MAKAVSISRANRWWTAVIWGKVKDMVRLLELRRRIALKCKIDSESWMRKTWKRRSILVQASFHLSGITAGESRADCKELLKAANAGARCSATIPKNDGAAR